MPLACSCDPRLNIPISQCPVHGLQLCAREVESDPPMREIALEFLVDRLVDVSRELAQRIAILARVESARALYEDAVATTPPDRHYARRVLEAALRGLELPPTP